LSISTAVNHVVDDSVEIKLLAVDFICNAYEVLGLHQLKLMSYRRDYALVSFLRVFDEVAIAMLHFLLDDATPAESMICQFAIPLVVVERDFTFREHLLRRVALGPRFGAHQIVRLTFHRRIVPGIEQLAR